MLGVAWGVQVGVGVWGLLAVDDFADAEVDGVLPAGAGEKYAAFIGYGDADGPGVGFVEDFEVGLEEASAATSSADTSTAWAR